MNSPALERADSLAHQVGLKELWSMFVAGWPIMLLSLIAALAVAGTYYFMTRSEFEATYAIAIGEVATADSVRKIESVDAVVERMRTPEFIDDVIDLLAWRGDERETLLKRSYSVYPVAPSVRYIQLRVRGYSVEDARRAGEASVAKLADVHREFADRIEAETTSRMATVASDILDLENLLAEFDSVLAGVLSPADRVQLQKLAIEARIELRTLRLSQTRMASVSLDGLEEQTIAKDVSLPQRPVHPDRWRVAVLAAFTGFFVGVLLIASRALLRAEKERRAAVQLERAGQLPPA